MQRLARPADAAHRATITATDEPTPKVTVSVGGEVVRWLGTNIEVESQLNAEAALEVSEAKLQVLTDAMPQMVWSTLPDGYHDYFNARWYEFTGVPYGSTDGEGWNGVFHAEDQERAWGLCINPPRPDWHSYHATRCLS